MAFVLLFAYWLTLAVATHLPASRLPGGVGASDKSIHFLAFFGLGFLFSWALRATAPNWRMFVAVGICIVYAAIDELTQGLIPSRSPEMGDFVADSLGAVTGCALFVVVSIVYGFAYRCWRDV